MAVPPVTAVKGNATAVFDATESVNVSIVLFPRSIVEAATARVVATLALDTRLLVLAVLLTFFAHALLDVPASAAHRDRLAAVAAEAGIEAASVSVAANSVHFRCKVISSSVGDLCHRGRIAATPLLHRQRSDRSSCAPLCVDVGTSPRLACRLDACPRSATAPPSGTAPA